jgi:tetratricopeptide (TPR) repeat protein
MSMGFGAVVLALGSCVVQLAWAAPAPDPQVAAARAHFEEGRVHYGQGQYQDALRQFEAGYAIAREPRFLINIAQAHRRLGEPGRAREALARFLEIAPVADSERPRVAELLWVVSREVETTRVAAPPSEPAPAHAPVVAPPSPPRLIPERPPLFPRALEIDASAPGSRRGRRLAAWLVPLSAAVLSAAALTLVFTLQPKGACDEATVCLR